MSKVSPNSFAILGLLAARPWSAYDLARHMKTSSNLRQIWPRAESKIYQAPKDLEVAGWATSHEEHTGRRRRTVYQITPKGRTALRKWLDEPAPPLHLEFEAALKVAYATAGTISQLNDTLQSLEEGRRRVLDEIHTSLPELLDQGFTIPERVHTSALVANLVARIGQALGEWNTWAQEAISHWDDIEIDDDKRIWAESVYRDLLTQLEHAMTAPADDAAQRPTVNIGTGHRT